MTGSFQPAPSPSRREMNSPVWIWQTWGCMPTGTARLCTAQLEDYNMDLDILRVHKDAGRCQLVVVHTPGR